jgi:cation/acetate symporter
LCEFFANSIVGKVCQRLTDLFSGVPPVTDAERCAMSADIYDRIKKNPKFTELVNKRSGYAWMLTFIVLILFYGFILLVAFNPALMSLRLGGEAAMITLGPVIILSMFVLFWVLTAMYVRRANGEFDELTRTLISEAARGDKK